MIAGVLHRLLTSAAGASIVADLATSGSPLAPNIFTGGSPENVGLPAIFIDEKGGPSWGTRGQQGADLFVDISVYDNKSRSNKKLSDLAWKIRRLVNRNSLTAELVGSGFQNFGCRADPPAALDDSLGFPGYLIRVRILVLDA